MVGEDCYPTAILCLSDSAHTVLHLECWLQSLSIRRKYCGASSCILVASIVYMTYVYCKCIGFRVLLGREDTLEVQVMILCHNVYNYVQGTCISIPEQPI